LEPGLNKIPEEVRPYIESEEDKITYVLFPQTAVEFFKKRKTRREDSKTGMQPVRIAELEEAAAIAVAVGAFLTSSNGAKALTLTKPRNRTANWVLAGRQTLCEHGA
jgi:hypothetical protein